MIFFFTPVSKDSILLEALKKLVLLESVLHPAGAGK